MMITELAELGWGDRAIWLAAGAVIGIPLGYNAKTAKDARAEAGEAHKEAHEAHLRVVKLEDEVHEDKEHRSHG